MDTRLHQFLSVAFSPAYADEAMRRAARRRRDDAPTSRRPSFLLRPTSPAQSHPRRDHAA